MTESAIRAVLRSALKGQVQEQAEAIERHDLEMRNLQAHTREQADTVTKLQQINEVLWKELEQRKGDEAAS